MLQSGFKILLSIVLLALCSSCGPKLYPFTQEMYDRYTWNEQDLKQIQFYLSKDVILKRSSSEGTSIIVKGKIEDKQDRQVQQIVIPSKTPGVLVYFPKANRFGISFDTKGNAEYLMFGPNPKSGGKYVLLAKSWKNRKGQISYGGDVYTTDLGASFAHLLVNIKKVHRVGVREKVAGGRRVD